MSTILFCCLYAGGLVFLAGCLVRIYRYATAPIHLRWELYPVPAGKSGQLKAMIPEILLIKSLWESNRPMWLRSYPFHFGLYLLAATTALALLAALPWTEALGRLLHPLYCVTGFAGLVLALAGALGLLWRRLTDKELKLYTTPGDLFNLILFAVTLALLLAGALLKPAAAPGPGTILRGALTFDTGLQPPALLAAGLILGSVLLAYIPVTHMAHFIAKYFTYHAVRWDDHSNADGSFDRRMAVYLGYRPTWAARHVGADGVRTWGEIATTNPTKGGS